MQTHDEPFTDECRNHGQGAIFTCPGCYADLDVEEGIHACPKCGRTVRCYIEDKPVSHCKLVEDEDWRSLC